MEHKFEVIPKEEILNNRCNAYEFINFDKDMKQTAVEFYWNKLIPIIEKLSNREYKCKEDLDYDFFNVFNESIIIEKKQIFEAHHRGYKDGECFSAEEYYNETFNNK